MKTNYHLKSSTRRRGEYALTLYILAIFLFIVFVIHTLFPSFLTGVFSALAYPVYKGEQALVADVSKIIVSKEELVKENEDLKRRISELENQYLALPMLTAENAELKELLGRSINRTTILARVLVKPPVSLYDTLVIDIGGTNGIKVGDKVYADGDILIGVISEVSGFTAKAKLYSSPGEKYDVQIGDQKVTTAATGRGNGTFEITLPRELEVKEGDPVTIPSIKPTIFGTVTSVSNDPVRAFQQVIFSTPVNMQALSWVLIETSHAVQ